MSNTSLKLTADGNKGMVSSKPEFEPHSANIQEEPMETSEFAASPQKVVSQPSESRDGEPEMASAKKVAEGEAT